jgi:hypothetical protein
MRANTIRFWLIGLLVVAAGVSVLGKKAGSSLVGWISFAVFLCAVVLYVRWRRAVAEERRGRVFDREAKTRDETRSGPDR